MKKQLTVALGLAVLATPAFASKARLQALGESVDGSFYVNDLRNVFLNAANVNNHKDTVTFEWGTTGSLLDGIGPTSSPRAEGGFFKSAGNINYGVYLGSESNTSNYFRSEADVQMEEENNIDVFVGGDAGVKWGANLTYSKSAEDETIDDATQTALRTRLGVISGDVEAFANISLSNKAEDANGDELKGKLGYQVGAIYNLDNNYRLFAEYRSNTAEVDHRTAANDGDLKATQLQVGAGHTSKLNDKANLFTKVQYQMNKAENDTALKGDFSDPTCTLATSVSCEEYSASFIPVVVGLEYDAASWLVLRGSVAQTIWGTQEDADDKKGFAESTVVNAGASLKFGDLVVDGVIGNSNAGAAATANDTSAGAGNLRTDNLMSRVSMTYRF